MLRVIKYLSCYWGESVASHLNLEVHGLTVEVAVDAGGLQLVDDVTVQIVLSWRVHGRDGEHLVRRDQHLVLVRVELCVRLQVGAETRAYLEAGPPSELTQVVAEGAGGERAEADGLPGLADEEQPASAVRGVASSLVEFEEPDGVR